MRARTPREDSDLLCALIGLWPGLIAGLLHAALRLFLIAPLIKPLGICGGARNFENTASDLAPPGSPNVRPFIPRR